jgi:hypothetical protein
MPFQNGNQDAAYSIEKIKELAKQYIQHLAEGFNKNAFWPCTYTTIEDRIEKEPDVFHAEKIGIEQAVRKSQLLYEKIGKENLVNIEKTSKDSEGNFTTVKTSLNAAAWIFTMKNKFPKDWKDSQQSDINVGITEVIRPKAPEDIDS